MVIIVTKILSKYVFGQTNTVCPKDYSLDVNIVCTKDDYKAG